MFQNTPYHSWMPGDLVSLRTETWAIAGAGGRAVVGDPFIRMNENALLTVLNVDTEGYVDYSHGECRWVICISESGIISVEEKVLTLVQGRT